MDTNRIPWLRHTILLLNSLLLRTLTCHNPHCDVMLCGQRNSATLPSFTRLKTPSKQASWDHEGRVHCLLLDPCGKAPWLACCSTCSGLFNFESTTRSTFLSTTTGPDCMACMSGRRPVACLMNVLIDLHCIFIVSLLLSNA